MAPITISCPGWPAARRVLRLFPSVSVTLILAMGFLAGCGVQAPPQPPRIERPTPVKDLQAIQIGQAFHLDFTLPTLATDGERLTKPLELEIFRTVTPPGETPEPPSTGAAPTLRLGPSDLARYVSKGKVDYPWSLSDQAYRQWQNSTFAFGVVTLTRGFRGRPRKSAPSDIAQTNLIDSSEPVTNLAVKTTQAALDLSWTEPAQTLSGVPVSHLAAYRVYQSRTGKPGSFRLLAETKTPSFADPNFRFGQTYYFQVSAVSAVNGVQAESEPSATVGITPRDIFPPAVPRRLTAIYSVGAVDLLWNANTDADLAGYNVYRRTSDGQFERVNKKLLSTPIFHDTSVVPNQRYQYAVTAVDLSGNESAKSEPVWVSTSVPGGP